MSKGNNNGKKQHHKMTKKEIKQMNHLKLIQGHKDKINSFNPTSNTPTNNQVEKKKAA